MLRLLRRLRPSPAPRRPTLGEVISAEAYVAILTAAAAREVSDPGETVHR